MGSLGWQWHAREGIIILYNYLVQIGNALNFASIFVRRNNYRRKSSNWIFKKWRTNKRIVKTLQTWTKILWQLFTVWKVFNKQNTRVESAIKGGNWRLTEWEQLQDLRHSMDFPELSRHLECFNFPFGNLLAAYSSCPVQIKWQIIALTSSLHLPIQTKFGSHWLQAISKANIIIERGNYKYCQEM